MPRRELTFELRRSRHGIGVFPLAAIKKNAEVILWEKGDWQLNDPKTFADLKWANKWGIYAWDKLWCPKSKIRMSIAWYINHSKAPNLRTRFTKTGNWRFWALRAIKAGEELTIDYSQLDYMGE
jgi:SET domain-containing protein